MVTLSAVSPEARASAITRSESVRRASSVTASSRTFMSMRPPSALTMIRSLRADCAAAGGATAAAPARARKARRSSSIILPLLRRDWAIVGAIEATAAFHGEQDRAQVGDVGDGIPLEHDEIGDPSGRDRAHRLALAEGHRAD